MDMIDKFLENNVSLRGMLDTYLELRLHLQEEGYSQESLERVVRPTNKMIELRERFVSKKNSLFKQFVNNNNFNVIYNIPYHSELNPIEYIFSLLRKELLYNDNSSYEQIITIINNFIKNFNKTYSYNIFNKCFDIINE